MHLQSLDFENLRTFERASIRLNRPGAPLGPVDFDNVNLILGDNGAGKTTVLKAAALGLLAPLLATSSGFRPYSLVRRTSSPERRLAMVRASFTVHPADGAQPPDMTDAQTARLEGTSGYADRFESLPDPGRITRLWDDAQYGMLILGYGSNRRVEPDVAFSEESRLRSRALRYVRVAGLFEESVPLVPMESWLPRLARDDMMRRDECLALLDQLLDEQVRARRDVDSPKEAGPFVVEGMSLPFEALSDGYRAFLAWIGDLLFHLNRATPPGERLVDQPGVVLVDEVDLHLHPEWQQRVIPAVARAFPQLQFVFTSHSPLVVGSLRQANVFVVERTIEGTSVLAPSPAEVFGLSADQILTSGHFGLASGRAPAFVDDLQAQAVKAQSGDPEAAIQLLRMMTLGKAAGLPGDQVQSAAGGD